MKDIRLVLPSLGCILAFALMGAAGCNDKSATSTAPATEAQTPPKMKMTTEIPPEITTPDSVETRIGTLKFFDGFPDDKTTQLVYDNLDFQRGVQAFLRGIPGASIQAFLPAAKKFGGVDGNVMIFEDLMDSKALWLTANNSSVYFFTWFEQKLISRAVARWNPPGAARIDVGSLVAATEGERARRRIPDCSGLDEDLLHALVWCEGFALLESDGSEQAQRLRVQRLVRFHLQDFVNFLVEVEIIRMNRIVRNTAHVGELRDRRVSGLC